MEDVVLFNPAWWNALPESYRKVITEAFLEVRPEVEAMKEEAMTKALEQLKASGKIETRTLSEAERQAWRERMAPAAEAAYLQRAGAEGKKALELYKAELQRLGG
jgi:C4-dicarboxylate-binding protein DctP